MDSSADYPSSSVKVTVKERKSELENPSKKTSQTEIQN